MLKKHSTSKMASKPNHALTIQVSVIVPTHNRASLLNKTLNSLLNQTFSPQHFEVIIVDNGSTDNTESICKEFQKKFTNYVYIYDKKPGLHVGRHAGLKAAKGTILVFIDDDIQASAA